MGQGQAEETPQELPREPLFDAVLHPHRSLSPSGFVILMVAVSLVCFAAGVAFALIGAWPVFGFFGLDVLLIYFAFRINYRWGRMYETVVLTEDTLTVERGQPRRAHQSLAFPALLAAGQHRRPAAPRQRADANVAWQGAGHRRLPDAGRAVRGRRGAARGAGQAAPAAGLDHHLNLRKIRVSGTGGRPLSSHHDCFAEQDQGRRHRAAVRPGRDMARASLPTAAADGLARSGVV